MQAARREFCRNKTLYSTSETASGFALLGTRVCTDLNKGGAGEKKQSAILQKVCFDKLTWAFMAGVV